MPRKKYPKGKKVIEVLDAMDSAWHEPKSMDLDERYDLMKSRVARAVRKVC